MGVVVVLHCRFHSVYDEYWYPTVRGPQKYRIHWQWTEPWWPCRVVALDVVAVVVCLSSLWDNFSGAPLSRPVPAPPMVDCCANVARGGTTAP